MRMKHVAGVLRVELRANVPAMFWDFDYLDQSAVRIASNTLHACSFVVGKVLIIELVTVTVAFGNQFLSVDIACAAAFAQLASIST